MNEEILSGLRISLEGGYTLDSAVQSFLNAGYNPAEVHEAAAMLSKPLSSSLTQPSPQIPVQPLPKMPQVSELTQETKPTASPKMKLLLIIAIIIILLIIAGTIITLLFKDQIINLFTS